MMSPQRSLAVGAVLLVGLGCLVLAAVHIRGGDHLAISVLLGTLFGQTAIAASWAALGPGRWHYRWPLSLVWPSLLVTSLHLGTFWHGDSPFFLAIAIPMLALEWLGIQPLAWGLALLAKLHVRHADAAGGKEVATQFGIGHLMIFTTIVAALLGIGRLAVASGWLEMVGPSDFLVFVFLIATAVVMNLPLIVAALLTRRTRLAVAIALGFMVLVAAVEMPIFLVTNLSGPDIVHMLLINAVTTAWVGCFLLLTRWCGYRFG